MFNQQANEFGEQRFGKSTAAFNRRQQMQFGQISMPNTQKYLSLNYNEYIVYDES